jgi:hypothetical protein
VCAWEGAWGGVPAVTALPSALRFLRTSSHSGVGVEITHSCVQKFVHLNMSKSKIRAPEYDKRDLEYVERDLEIYVRRPRNI